LPWWLTDELWEIELNGPVQLPDMKISLTIVGDGAVCALAGDPPASAYVAAHAAMRSDSAEGYAAERAWQSRWLMQRLALGQI
jgi:hypothetical protein